MYISVEQVRDLKNDKEAIMKERENFFEILKPMHDLISSL